jgi:hypothetical protein
MSTPSGPALREHDKRVRAMLADPDCCGELLLVGIAMARALDLGDPAPLGPAFSLKDVARTLYGPVRIIADLALPAGPGWQDRHRSGVGDAYRRLLDVLHSDIRRYVPTDTPFGHVTCGRPRVRTDGACGRGASANHTKRLVDPLTGEKHWVGACSNTACKAWLAAVAVRNREELAAHPPPVPPANAGGVLERHLPEIDWWKLWSHLDERWTPPPEAEPFHPPKLQLVLCDPDPAPAATPAGRPALTVLTGGW